MVKNLPVNAGKAGSIPGLGRSLGEGNCNPTPVFLPGKAHGQRSLAGYSPQGCKEADTNEWQHTHTRTDYNSYRSVGLILMESLWKILNTGVKWSDYRFLKDF